jgi:RecJ-like exonuclease
VSRWEKCPVCAGAGSVWISASGDIARLSETISSDAKFSHCPRCDGEGKVPSQQETIRRASV